MTAQDTARQVQRRPILPGAAVWLWLSTAAALLAIAGNIVALSVRGIYAALTPAFWPQAVAQDIASLAIVSPLWLIVAMLALRGSLRAYLLWLGVLVFTVYNYVIYTFSVPFGPLFLLWVAVLGMSVFSLIGGISAIDPKAAEPAFTSRRAAMVVAWALIISAVLFGLLWLSEDVPALLSNTRPQSLVDVALPTNPVHILDLSFFLPVAIATGIFLIKRKALAYALAPALIVFMILTGIPIMLTPVVQATQGGVAAWGAVAPIGTLTAIQVALLVWFLLTIRLPAKAA